MPSEFAQRIAEAYAVEGEAIELGRGVHEGELHRDAVVRLPLAMTNRHGLVAGATGTGKTRTLQLVAEQLSAAGVPVFVGDVKGDVSGMSEPGPGGKAAQRMEELGLPWEPAAFPVEFYSLGGIGPGVPIRASVSDFGPQLLAKILGANETQEQALALVFRYADDRGLPLVDLSDLRALLAFLDSDEGKDSLEGLGGVSGATIGVLLRALVPLEDGGGTELFGEPQLRIEDLLRTAPDGRGIVSMLELAAVQELPQLWSTATMWLLAELFETLPEVGDLPKPKLVFFLDEAHLLFKDATPAFVESVVRTVRLIRSKGVGVFFVTQSPTDIPRDVLAQLGNRIQHSLRAFTAEDAEALRQAPRTYPKSEGRGSTARAPASCSRSGSRSHRERRSRRRPRRRAAAGRAASRRTRWSTSSPRARASRSRARSCAASSPCSRSASRPSTHGDPPCRCRGRAERSPAPARPRPRRRRAARRGAAPAAAPR